MLNQTDNEQGMGMFKIFTMTKLPESGYQSPLVNGQYMISKLRLDEAGDSRPCGAFTNSKDQSQATLIHDFLPNTTKGPILSIRAFEL